MMCGRYEYLTTNPKLKKFWVLVSENGKAAQGEVFPSNDVVTLGADKDGTVKAGLTHWGFEGFKKGQLMINARAETVTEKKTFKKPFEEHRCVFPMSGFYEWNTEKEKFLFTSDDILYIGGFYRTHESKDGWRTESIILTTQPNETVAPIHDRMPLIIEENDIEKWIKDEAFAKDYLKKQMEKLKKVQV
ncbi:hypothetical protein IGI57_000225 [Enterococcus sp. DIV0213j]